MEQNHTTPKSWAWVPEFEYRKVLLKECPLAGVSFHIERHDDLWHELTEGTELALVRERTNPHDRNAVAVALAGDYDGDPDDFDFNLILGYVPRTENAELAALIDAGYSDKISATISHCNRHAAPAERIRIFIWVESLEPQPLRPDGLLRAHSLTMDEMNAMANELRRRGTVYFRFGGYPCHEAGTLFPRVGEKIVMMHSNDDDDVTADHTVLYLMHVLATGNDCAAYVDDPDSIHAVDDCSPYILTNVMGPLKLRTSRYPILATLSHHHLTAMDYLNRDYSAALIALLHRHLRTTLLRTTDIRTTDPNPDVC